MNRGTQAENSEEKKFMNRILNEIKEIIKKIITLNVKGKTFMFTVPEKILKSESRSQYRLLQKWFKHLWLSQSTWKLYSSQVNPSG